MSASMDGAHPHATDVMMKSTIDARNNFTWPYRCVSQPVRGKEIALATPKDVMTQVP